MQAIVKDARPRSLALIPYAVMADTGYPFRVVVSCGFGSRFRELVAVARGLPTRTRATESKAVGPWFAAEPRGCECGTSGRGLWVRQYPETAW